MKKKNVKKSEKDVAELRNNDLLREDALMAALAEAGLSAEGTVAERATTLEAYYLGQKQPVGWDDRLVTEGGKGAWHLQCMIEAGGCGYHSIATRPHCDFCGDGQAEIGTTAPVDTSAAMTVVSPSSDSAIDGELIEDEGGIPPPGAPDGSVEELDAAVNAVNEARRALDAGERTVTGYEWDLGQTIFTIFRRTLYVQRKKDGGAPLYSSWPQFCKAELGISSGTANRLMRIAVNFSRELACDLGPSKLAELLPAAEAQAAEDQRAARLGSAPKLILPPLLDRARVVPVADLRVEVKAALPASTAGQRGKTGKATAAAAAKKNGAVKKPEIERVTVQRQEGSIKLRFFQSEEAARAGDKAKVAKKWKEGIVAIEPAVNGVECVYQIRDDVKLGLVLHRKVIRVDG